MCAHLNVDRSTAIRGMHQAQPDPGVLRRYTVQSGAKTVQFVNAFAANDPQSTRLIWQRLGLDRAEPGVRPDDRSRTGVSRRVPDCGTAARAIERPHIIITETSTIEAADASSSVLVQVTATCRWWWR